MKVFYINPQSYNNLSTYDLSLLKNIQGHDVTYYHCDQYQHDILPGNSNKCYFHYNKKKYAITKGISYLCSIIRITIDAIIHKPDIVHVQWLRVWHIDYVFALLMHWMGIRLIFTAHNILPHVIKKNDKRHYKRYYKLVDNIIVHNSRTRKELAELMDISERKIKVIFHGVLNSDTAKADVISRADELRELLHIKPSDIVFSCLGVQKEYKGTSLVIDIWADNPELNANPNTHLLIVGRSYGIDYTPIIGFSNVYILDQMISDLDFDAYLHLSSAILLPYIRISQSGLLFSAVNQHIPVLVSDVGGLTEPLSYGNIGWNIGTPTKENLQRQMLELVRRPDEIEAIKNNSQEFDKVRKAYDWESIGEKTSSLYSGEY